MEYLRGTVIASEHIQIEHRRVGIDEEWKPWEDSVLLKEDGDPILVREFLRRVGDLNGIAPTQTEFRLVKLFVETSSSKWKMEADDEHMPPAEQGSLRFQIEAEKGNQHEETSLQMQVRTKEDGSWSRWVHMGLQYDVTDTAYDEMQREAEQNQRVMRECILGPTETTLEDIEYRVVRVTGIEAFTSRIETIQRIGGDR